MQSRMERYYKKADKPMNERSAKNQELYKSIYETGEYSNIEGIATLDKTNEIDLSKIREMLEGREGYKREKKYRQIVKQEEPIRQTLEEEVESFNEEEKNYDIRDVLNKAKTERTQPMDMHYNLNHTQYDILNKLNTEQEKKKSENEELHELIHTITSSSSLHQMEDSDLSLSMFEDLKSVNNTMVGAAGSMKTLLEEEKEQYKDDDKVELDQSFFTSSLNFKDDDFEEIREGDLEDKKNNILLNILLFLLGVMVLSAIGYLVFVVIK